MKIGGMVAASVLAAGIGTAQAQTAACNQMLLLLTTSQARLADLRGEEIKRDAKKITHKSKTQVLGFTDCTLECQGPNGQAGTFGRAKGVAGFNAEGSIHKVANVGDSICILLIVERK